MMKIDENTFSKHLLKNDDFELVIIYFSVTEIITE